MKECVQRRPWQIDMTATSKQASQAFRCALSSRSMCVHLHGSGDRAGPYVTTDSPSSSSSRRKPRFSLQSSVARYTPQHAQALHVAATCRLISSSERARFSGASSPLSERRWHSSRPLAACHGGNPTLGVRMQGVPQKSSTSRFSNAPAICAGVITALAGCMKNSSQALPSL
eukprot:CAMPEP_0175341816 /NCGR_PEP_ID=MMETSP0095-20121207/6530_1 /TAXON_ID=311494 /ORGANISM="Alexandrium monilatum, Strain CCMP3105" /LENGTH=171 /DNA_ID=CAMNT_0016639231 /DNA_START=127 /DNA_END=642 /DNA_ORIENTATION=-